VWNSAFFFGFWINITSFWRKAIETEHFPCYSSGTTILYIQVMCHWILQMLFNCLCFNKCSCLKVNTSLFFIKMCMTNKILTDTNSDVCFSLMRLKLYCYGHKILKQPIALQNWGASVWLYIQVSTFFYKLCSWFKVSSFEKRLIHAIIL